MSDDMESQHNAQLEGLAIGLEQRGEVSAAHVIRLALKRLERRADAMSDDIVLTEIERRALEHIRRNGDDRNLRAKSWTEIKRSLSRKGYLKRRIGDWAWIAAEG